MNRKEIGEKNLLRRQKTEYAAFSSRKQKIVTCPHCWTDQRTERDFCYRCGAEFLYLDEARKERIC